MRKNIFISDEINKELEHLKNTNPEWDRNISKICQEALQKFVDDHKEKVIEISLED